MNNPPPSSARSLKPRILVVDDVVKNLQVVGTMLRNEGYDVMPAGSGAQALDRVRVRLPDLILLDLMMPEMDGLEICRRLKADPVLRTIPVIFLTASNEMEHLVNGFEVGAVDYITKPFNAPELLARVRTHLELKLARERLKEMNEEKNEFMGIAAHDSRNPLSAIKGYAEMVVEDGEAMVQGSVSDLTACGQELKASGQRIGDTAARMAEMVQNLLDANRIERGEMQLNLAPTDLGPALNQIIETQRSHVTAKQQTIHLQSEATPVAVMLDPGVIVQILENLVSNAVKYSPLGRDIFVRLRKLPNGVRVEVQDEGPGLSVEDQKKLFGKFARLSAKPTGGEHSTGLGLSIVKKMVEAMNGKVWCESELGSGATFIVEFAAV
ncbi:MAG: hybrid sensor histidine kinase/response regulator [Verrucomicrobia bacterium]|nr:hybrid sensor histidine kinase/response regulator [Verrucomicrobiota bacterium]